ncbi:helix-turn-helix domain-containing protein [Clostridium perfringens]|uniref:helix-turn-helix domain-containing protein n=1 Tax=Clostridium perfringens TaxID=1502 RepID=UPI001ABB73A6|nr:helix-turn-helix transcriptional regulator [Clostridium perfringens]EHK2357045.1 helix-turn-helix transcriptional regulator [Clostridium perfringens]MBO3363297.1 helix-turn-helix transcriptional regulator [Clostridium perfringens]
METIGDRIKKYRKNLNWTQQQLADKLEKSKSTIQKYESNSVKLNSDVMNSLCKVLNIDLLELLYGEKIEDRCNCDWQDLNENKVEGYINFVDEVILTKLIDSCSKFSDLDSDLIKKYYYSLSDLFNWESVFDPSTELVYITKYPTTNTIVIPIDQFILFFVNIILLEENFFNFSHKSEYTADNMRNKILNIETEED